MCYDASSSVGHYGIEENFNRIAKRYCWTYMLRYITEYIKNYNNCSRHKLTDMKPSGLLPISIYSQRFETLSVDLFGSLSDSNSKKLIFVVPNCIAKLVEIFSLQTARAKEYVITFIEAKFVRYGLSSRRIITDKRPHFVSAIMQQICFLLKIQKTLTYFIIHTRKSYKTTKKLS